MKRTHARRFAGACAIAALATVSLVGCSSDSGSQEQGEQADSKGATIEYWHRLPDADGMIKVSQAAEQFNKEHDFTVETKKFEGNAAESYDKISSAIKAGNAPCLAQASFDGIPAMVTRGELVDVTKQAEKYKDHYSESTWTMTSPGGKTYGIPQDSGPMVYFYDKDKFDELGLTAPTTWEEYWKLAADAKEKGVYTSAFLTDDAAGWYAGINSARSASWFQVEGDGWKVAVDSDVSKKVAEEWQKSIADGTTLLVKRWDENDFNPQIAEGKLIGYISAAWDAPLIFDKSGKDSANWRIAQMPDTTSGPWGGSALVVLKGCKNIDAALEFADWYNTNLEAMGSQGLVPAAKGNAPKPEWAKFYGDQDVMAELAKANDNMDPNWLFSPTWGSVQKVFNDNAAKLSSGATLPDILTATQDEAVKTLESSGIKVVK